MEDVPVGIMLRHQFGANDTFAVSKRALCHKVWAIHRRGRGADLHVCLETERSDFDPDARKMQAFILGELSNYLAWATTPLAGTRRNKLAQRKDFDRLLTL